MSKSREEKSAQAQERLAQEQRAAGERQRVAGRAAERRITEIGRPTAQETARLARYKGRATMPAETLMTQAGPISQAVARRVLERVETPGLEYQRDLPAYEAGVTEPLWRALKQRGIAAPPGVEGGGLGTQQYMKGAEPALALLRAEAISRDIGRGQEYGAEARGYKGWYEQLESALSEALRAREIAGVTGGAPYGIRGEEAYGAGMVGGAQTEADYAAPRAKQQAEKRAQQAKLAMMVALGGISGGAGATGGWDWMEALKGAAGGGLKALTPRERQLEVRT